MLDASKRGRANKRAGYTAEKRLERLLIDWGIECWRVPLSGAIKTEGLDSDLRMVIAGQTYKIENKRRADLDKFYKLDSVVIEGLDHCL